MGYVIEVRSVNTEMMVRMWDGHGQSTSILTVPWYTWMGWRVRMAEGGQWDCP